MKLKDGFVTRNVGGRKIAVATGALSDTFKGMISLNETADFIFGMLNNGCKDEDEIVAALTDNYDVGVEVAKADVRSFVSKLSELNLIDGSN